MGSVEALGCLLYILHKFILPPCNNLPSTHKIIIAVPMTAFYFVMSIRILNSAQIVATTNIAVVWASLLKDFKYMPLIPCIRRMFSITDVSKQIQQHSSVTSNKQVISLMISTNHWHENGAFHGDGRALSFGLCTDGMNPFIKEKTSYSLWPVTLSFLNLPSHVWTKFTSLMGIIPGPREPKNVDPYLKVLVDELLDLSKKKCCSTSK